MTEKQVIEAALVRCGMTGKAASELARAVVDCKYYWPDLVDHQFGELHIQVFKGEYERCKVVLSQPKPPKE